MSANGPKTGREALALLDAERDHLPALARRCVDQALGEMGLHNLEPPNYEVAYRAALIAMRHAEEAVTSARKVAEYAAFLRPPA